jgi:hypothetical protein
MGTRRITPAALRLLMAADWARCRELSARIRADLIHLGLVDATRSIRIADGAEASAGDLIICRRNDHAIEAGEPGQTLADGDILRIEAVTGPGIMVRRLLEPDRTTGWRRFTDLAFRFPATGPLSWPMRSPVIPLKAAPCIPGSRWAPAARTGSGCTRR